MITYFNNLNRKVNETLTLYTEIGKLSKPFFNYVLMLVSILILTSCFSIIYSLSNNDFSSENNFVHIALPIMIYGLIAPILSTIISYIFKEFIQQQIQLLKCNKKLLLIKSSSIIDKKIILNKENLTLLTFFIIIYSIDILNFYYNLCLNIIIFCFITLYKVNNKLRNDLSCSIISIEKCYDKNEEYYRYNIELNYGDKKKYIQKRFNDFKELNYNLNNDRKLPTSSWMISPNDLKQATTRGNRLNSYLKNIFKDDKNLNNTIVNKFIKNDNNKEEDIRIIEKKNLNSNSNLDELKKNISLKLGIHKNNIKEIFILNEINYYMNLKKRIFMIIDNFLYKIKYHKSNDSFDIRLKIDLSDINKLIIGRIINTTHFINRDVLEIIFKQEKIILTSFDNDNIYNITSLYKYLLYKIQQEIDIIHNYDYKLWTGLGLTESLFNNPSIMLFKNLFKS